MNYAGLLLGTWYPEKGMYRIIEAMEELAVELGVKIHTNHEVSNVLLTDNNVSGLVINGETYEFDAVIASGDYKHMETLLPHTFRNYTDDYWSTRTLAPSSLIFFLGFDKKIHSIEHHTLFFDESLEKHTEQIYFDPKWPEKPLFYVCAPSKTDPSVAPENCENIFILIPIAAGLEDNEEIREKYFNIIIDRLEKQVEEPIKEHIIYKKSYCINDFKADYHSYKGNAYGLANTLRQTAILKPKLNNKKLKNLIYAGHLTVPGPGVPPALISGKLAANELIKLFKK